MAHDETRMIDSLIAVDNAPAGKIAAVCKKRQRCVFDAAIVVAGDQAAKDDAQIGEHIEKLLM